MSLTVLSYNIREGGQDRLAQIAAVIRGQQPDAVALLEADNGACARWLADELGLALVYGEANNRHGIAWLSRLPIVRSENHRSRLLAKTLLEIEVPLAADSVGLFATHLGSRHDLPRAVTELPVILDVMRRRRDRPHLLVGDFNALAPGDPVGVPPAGIERRGEAVDGAPRPALPLLPAAGYVDAYRVLHPEEPGYTYTAEVPWLRLDYAFLCPRLAGRLLACDVVTGLEAAQASDHLPLRVELR